MLGLPTAAVAAAAAVDAAAAAAAAVAAAAAPGCWPKHEKESVLTILYHPT